MVIARPMLFEIPMPLRTERLVIRPYMNGEGKELFALIQESRKDLEAWMPWVTKHKTWEDSEEYVRRSQADWVHRQDLPMGIFLNGEDLVGATGLHRIDWTVPKFEIGYWLGSAHTKKGYAREAVGALTRFTFKQLKARRVEIRCDKKNIPSSNIPAALGFEHEATLKAEVMDNLGKELRDTLIFSRWDVSGLPEFNALW